MSFNTRNYQHVPIRDAYKIFVEKCEEDGIKPPTFEEFKNRR